MKRKGQAAMEFLMTYGWAILVVLIVIGALAYFGVLNPQTLLPERCELQLGIRCKDHLISAATDDIRLSIENGRGSDVMLSSLMAYSPELGVGCSVDLTGESAGSKPGRLVRNGGASEVTLACAGVDPLSASFVQTGKKKFDMNVTWYSFDSTNAFSHISAGQLLANVEP